MKPILPAACGPEQPAALPARADQPSRPIQVPPAIPKREQPDASPALTGSAPGQVVA
jgi:hypothetical protein